MKTEIISLKQSRIGNPVKNPRHWPFQKLVNGLNLLINFAKNSILDAQLGSGNDTVENCV